ncbi:GIY-YIG nuclease family protein [Hyphobacterium sp. CCMP332]|nr:GIY-YIG nuclease family protein [Hyphobacterium sp. CCMP332]
MFQVFYVYILSNKNNNVLYTGFTNDIYRRTLKHKNGLQGKFTKTYKVNKLVYFESHNSADEALHREYLLKRWKRKWKNELIESINPNWRDLFDDFVGEREIPDNIRE